MAKRPDNEAGAVAHLVGAASMASVAALANRMRQSPPPIIIEEEATGLQPFEPDGFLKRISDRFPRLHLPMAVLQRYSKTRAGQQAALVVFSGFVSIFPLFIAMNTILDIVLRDRADLRRRLVSTAVGGVPVIGDQLRVGSGRGSGVALVLGLLGALWAALAAMNALQGAINDVWQVVDRPNFVLQRLRSMAGLVIVGISLVVATGLSGLATSSDLPLALAWGIVGSFLVNVVGVALSSSVLSPATTLRSTRAGALLSGVLLTALQILGGILVTRYLVGASRTYGTFATVIALTSWFGLNAEAVLYGVALSAERAARRTPLSANSSSGF